VIDRLITSELFLCRLKLAQGDSVSAARFLSQAEQNAHQNEFALRLPDFAAHQVLIHLYNSDTGAAAQIVQNNNLPLLQARTLIAQGDSSAALRLLIPYRQQTEEKGWENQQLRAMVLQGLALHMQGEKDQARQVLSQTLILAEPGGFIRLFIENGELMRSLIVDYKSWIKNQSGDRTYPLKDYVDKLLAAFGLSGAMTRTKTSTVKSELIEPLSQRELEVLQLICQGLSNHEICQRLFLALDTVKGHNRRIFEKLQVHRRTEAIARSRELGLF
jgi:LuxR family maltose regulon positive regulatory protein